MKSAKDRAKKFQFDGLSDDYNSEELKKKEKTIFHEMSRGREINDGI